MEHQRSLSNKDAWEQMYRGDRICSFCPAPEIRCSAFEMARLFRRYLPPQKGLRLLEMGCGASRWLPFFYRTFGYEVFGVDYVESGCRQALENVKQAGGSGTFYCLDFFDLGQHFKSDYDVVLSLGVVEHFERPSEVVRIFADCLKPGGFLVTYVPNFSGLLGRFLKQLNRSLYFTHNLFSLNELISYHTDCCLSIVCATYHDFLDFSMLPYEDLPKPIMLLLKNAVHLTNTAKLSLYKRTYLNPQSRFLCSSMMVIAVKP